MRRRSCVELTVPVRHVLKDKGFSRIGTVSLDGDIIEGEVVHIAEIDALGRQDLAVDEYLRIGGRDVGDSLVIFLNTAVQLHVDISQGDIL